jgi:hypothetical protein
MIAFYICQWTIVQVSFDIHDYRQVCLTKSLVKGFLHLLYQPFINSSPSQRFRQVKRPVDLLGSQVICNLSLPGIFFIQVAVALNTVALSEIIRRGLVLLVMNKFNICWNSSADCKCVNLWWTALDVAHVNITT